MDIEHRKLHGKEMCVDGKAKRVMLEMMSCTDTTYLASAGTGSQFFFHLQCVWSFFLSKQGCQKQK